MRLIATTFLMLAFAFPVPSMGNPMPIRECAKQFPNLGVSGCKRVHQLYRSPEQTAKRLGKPLLYNGYAWVTPSGGNPSVFLYFVNRMNKQGNTLVFGRHCNSACAIAWNLARKKCLLFGGQVGLAQHKATGSGRPVNHKSRSASYWKQITRGKKEPSHDMVYWTGSAPKCPEGITVAGYRSERQFRSRDSRPSIFRAPY